MPHRSKIAILEDDSDRTVEMRRCVCDLSPARDIIFFDNAPEMIAWLGDHLSELRLICLDHDLGPNRLRNDVVFDPGTGRDVADFLAKRMPQCFVLIHTTNTLAAPGMELALGDAGWSCSRIVPYNDLEWIESAWIPAVKNALDTTTTL
jgi:hypothetical protein